MTGFLDNLALALSTLRSNPLRSALTLLGIVIGAATVVAMMSLTEGLRLKVTNDLSVLGAGSFHVQKWPAMSFGPTNWAKYARRKNFTIPEGEALKEMCDHVSRVSIEAQLWPPERVRTTEHATKPNVNVYGGTPDFELANGYSVAEGRFFSDVDMKLERRVAVIGADVADLLFPGESPLDKEIVIRATPFTVVGVLDRMGNILGMGSRDALVIAPLTAFQLAFGKNRNIEFTVQAKEPTAIEKAQDEVTAALRRLRGVKEGEENDFEIFSNDSMTGMFNQLAGTIAAATFGVCALALLVGGIGIMNIMLVSVTERTREIGIRKALGARRRRILSQFIIEATTLSALGGLLGIGLGAGLAAAARSLYAVPASIPLWAVVLSLATSSGCGLLFGIYPAARASRLDPVEAMRSE